MIETNIEHKTHTMPTVHPVEEVSARTGLSVERVMELTETGYIPHYRIDGDVYRFNITEVKRWMRENLTERFEGCVLSGLKIVIPAPEPHSARPTALQHIASLQEIPKYGYQPGVYFLCSNNRVVYVGQSTAPSNRIESHRQQKGDVFDRVFLIPVPKSELNEVESAFIDLLQPSLNGRSNNGVVLKPPSDKETDEVVARYIA